MSRVARILGVSAEIQMSSPSRLHTDIKQLKSIGNVVSFDDWNTTIIDSRNAAYIDPSDEEIRMIDHTVGKIAECLGTFTVQEMVFPVVGLGKFNSYLGYELEPTEKFKDMLGACQEIVLKELGIDVRRRREQKPHVPLVELHKKHKQPLPELVTPTELHCRGYNVGRAIVSMAHNRSRHYKNLPSRVRPR